MYRLLYRTMFGKKASNELVNKINQEIFTNITTVSEKEIADNARAKAGVIVANITSQATVEAAWISGIVGLLSGSALVTSYYYYRVIKTQRKELDSKQSKINNLEEQAKEDQEKADNERLATLRDYETLEVFLKAQSKIISGIEEKIDDKQLRNEIDDIKNAAHEEIAEGIASIDAKYPSR